MRYLIQIVLNTRGALLRRPAVPTAISALWIHGNLLHQEYTPTFVTTALVRRILDAV
jgi:hypothetical protein